jgi:hypothetical protein
MVTARNVREGPISATVAVRNAARGMVRPIMHRSTSMQSRLFATLVAATLAMAPLHVVHAAPSVEELYTQGQEKFDAGEYGDAGDLWAQAVRQLPEDKNNSATRQTIMNLALDSYLRAYRADNDRSHIDEAKALIDEYEASLQGTKTVLSDEIASEKGKIEGILADIAAAEAEAENEPDPETDPEPETEPDTDPLPVGNDKPGRGLVIGGAVMLGVGGAGIGLLLGGVIGGLRAQADFDATADGTAEHEDARKKGKTMNALSITGAVVAPLFIGAGVALLVIGLRKNKQARNSVMVLPEAGPGYAGFGISGRF